MLIPFAKKSRINDTQILVPRIHGFPKHIFGSTLILFSKGFIKNRKKLNAIEQSVESGRLKQKDKIAKRLYRWVNKWNMERFFSVEYAEGNFQYKRLEDEIERYALLDGCYVLVSNVKKELMDKDAIQKKYKDLKYVEQAFRSMKVSDLFLRPIRHWNEKRVKCHVFMCMLAYRIVWEARKRLHPILDCDPNTKICEGNSLREIWESLNKISIGNLSIAGHSMKQFSSINKHQRKILNLLKVQIGKEAKSLL